MHRSRHSALACLQPHLDTAAATLPAVRHLAVDSRLPLQAARSQVQLTRWARLVGIVLHRLRTARLHRTTRQALQLGLEAVAARSHLPAPATVQPAQATAPRVRATVQRVPATAPRARTTLPRRRTSHLQINQEVRSTPQLRLSTRRSHRPTAPRHPPTMEVAVAELLLALLLAAQATHPQVLSTAQQVSHHNRT